MGRSTSAVRRDRDRLLGAVTRACQMLVDTEARNRTAHAGALPIFVEFADNDFLWLVHTLDTARRAVSGVILTPKGQV